jgi:MFS family permease
VPWLRKPVIVGLALSLLAMGTSTFTTLGLGALAPYLRSEFHLSTFEVGALPALVFLGAVTASVPAGRLTDRIGAGRALALSLAGVAGGIGLAALAPTQAVFLLGVALGGVGYGAVNPATNVLSTSLVPRRHRAFFLSIKQAGVTLGGLVAGATLPSLADAIGWRAALLLPIGLLLCCVLVALWAGRREAQGWFDAPDQPEAARVRSLVSVSVPGGGPTALFGFISSGVQLSVAGYLTIYLVDTQGYSRPTAGLGLSLAFAAGCVGRLVWGALSDRRFSAHATTLVVSSTGSAVGLIALASGVGGAVLWVVIALVGFCSIGWNGVYMALITDRAGQGKLGRATGRGLVFLYFGVVAVPPLLGELRDAVDSWPVVWSAATAAVICAASMLAVGRRHMIRVPSGEVPVPDMPVGGAPGVETGVRLG